MSVGLVRLYPKDIISSQAPRQLQAVGLDGMSGIGDHYLAGQIHGGQVSGNCRFLVGVPGNDDLIDHSLPRCLEVDQGQRFV